MKNSKTRLVFPVKAFKRFDNPYHSKENPAKYQFFVNVNDVPAELEYWLGVNPREQKLNTDVARDIKNSLLDDNKDFHLLNRGILLSAEEILYDNKTNNVELLLSNFDNHGIIDGGHTYKIIINERENIDTEKYVSIEVVTQFPHIEFLAEARNTSVAVDDKSIEELKGSFEVIKGIIHDEKLGKDEYYNRIAFKQNEYWGAEEKNIIDVREIIAIMNMFNPYLYDPLDGDTHPIQSYTGKEVSLKKFLNLSPKGEKNKGNNVEFRNDVANKMVDILPDIYKLWDIIEKEFPTVSKDLNRRYGSKKYSNYNNDSIRKVSLFSNEGLDYTIPRGIMYPCVGAFRSLVQYGDNTGKLSWALDPFVVWEEKKESIVAIILDNSRAAAGDSPDQIGKSSLIWGALYNSIFIHRLRKDNQ